MKNEPSIGGRFGIEVWSSRGLWIVLVLLCFGTITSEAAGTALAWDPSPSPGVVGYKVHYGSISGTYTQIIDVGNVTNTVVTNLVVGTTNYFAVTSYDSTGLESQPSNEISAIVRGLLGRYVFYNHSAWDGNSAVANAADDQAIAPDKTPLRRGGIATFANYTSFSLGVNGIMIDIVQGGAVSASDFQFKVGNNNTPSTWGGAPSPVSVTVRAGAGTNGTDRVTIIWADNAIQKEWLEITVLATANTGLLSPDIFYFGNAIGETGNSAADAKVDPNDELLARANPANVLHPAALTNPYDFNRDKRVDPSDQLIARANQTSVLTCLRLLNLTALAGQGLSSMGGKVARAGDSQLALPPELPPAGKPRTSAPSAGTSQASSGARKPAASPTQNQQPAVPTSQRVFGIPSMLSVSHNNQETLIALWGVVGATFDIQSNTDLHNPNGWNTETNLSLTTSDQLPPDLQNGQKQLGVAGLAFTAAMRTWTVSPSQAEPMRFYRAVMADNYAILANQALQAQGHASRLIAVRMPGTDPRVVCYVADQNAYLDYDEQIYSIRVQPSDQTIREIAQKVASSMGQNWTSASEFTMANGAKQVIATVVETDAPASDPQPGQVSGRAGAGMTIDF